MVSQARQRLSDDHEIASKVLKQLLTALDNKDVDTSYSKLDLLWARLAVHIRAEHLYLFPAVTNRLAKSRDGTLPHLSAALAIVENLRADHDFFMRELARGMGILRELPQRIVTARNEAKLTAVGDIVRDIEKRLATHNEIEENQIYRWSSTILTKPEQLMLLGLINTELEKRPPRFSEDAWANCL
jgi:hypothetical protein